MQRSAANSKHFLSVKSLTWNKNSHSLYDYESTKVSCLDFDFSLSTKQISIYRKRQSTNVMAFDTSKQIFLDPQEYQLLTTVQIKPIISTIKVQIDFTNKICAKSNQDRLKTHETISLPEQEEEPFLIVKKFKDTQGQSKGCILKPGQTIKLGRIQYFVSEICSNGLLKTVPENKKTNKFQVYKNTMKYIKDEKAEQSHCKICLQMTQTTQNILINPCKCSGSCGTVHVDCLLEWINFKVKKQVVGGTLHYNFQKFECEVCKTQLPMIIEVANAVKQLLPLKKPKDNYLVLEAACQKLKSVMIIQNVPQQGIKLGRGHDCEIRIPDISVSRTHSIIKFIDNNFVLLDNKSKFGTLVREDNMSLEIGRGNKGIQVGRTIITFQIRKEKEKQRTNE